MANGSWYYAVQVTTVGGRKARYRRAGSRPGRLRLQRARPSSTGQLMRLEGRGMDGGTVAWHRDGIRPPVAVWTLRQLVTFLVGVENDRPAD
jgi:hypothetical protein